MLHAVVAVVVINQLNSGSVLNVFPHLAYCLSLRSGRLSKQDRSIMILAVRYTIKGVKKGHKKYKERQAEKEQKLLEQRGQLPDLQDPSRELDVTCQARLNRQQSLDSASTRSIKSSHSTRSAERALENDPGFREYMERHRILYLQQQQQQAGLPPSYNAVIQEYQSPTPSSQILGGVSPPSATHCYCHECTFRSQSTVPQPVGRHLSPQHPGSGPMPGHETTGSLTPRPAMSELDDTQAARRAAPLITELDSTSTEFELPGNLPAIPPHGKQELPAELPAHTA